MNINIANRYALSALAVIFYLVPILFFSFYSIRLMSAQKSWMLLSIGLFIAMTGALVFFFLLYYWERSFQERIEGFSFPQLTYSSEREEKVAPFEENRLFYVKQKKQVEDNEECFEKELITLQSVLKESQEEQEKLRQALELKEEELKTLQQENRQLFSGTQQVFQEFADYKLFSEEQLQQKQGQLSSLQQMIEEQRKEMEKRQEQIHQLDTKVHDLSYEIKTLLCLHEEENPVFSKSKEKEVISLWKEPIDDRKQVLLERGVLQEIAEETRFVHTPLEAIYLLKKCIQLVQKMTGAHCYGQDSSRYPEFSPSYAMDQRRLFDLLREETAALILVYSPKEEKVLFANSQSKPLLGWSPEKLVADFSFIMQGGLQEWKKALHTMTTVSETQLRLLAKTRQGQEIVLNAQLGLIPGGLFRGYLIGVFFV